MSYPRHAWVAHFFRGLCRVLAERWIVDFQSALHYREHEDQSGYLAAVL